MSVNSVQTNVGAMIALQSLNKTNTDLAATQKQVSTGYRVADATDDGAAFAVAQNVRSTVSSITTANQQLGSVQGLISTTQTGLTSVSNTMASMRDVLVKLADGNVSGNMRTQYQTQYNSLLAAVKSNIQDTSYNGATLVGDITGSSGNFARVVTIRNEAGATYGIATFGGAALYGSLSLHFAATPSTGTVPGHGTQVGGHTVAATHTTWGHAGQAAMGAADAAALLTAGGMFTRQMNAVGTALNTIGSEANFVSGQITFNNNKVDSLNAGLGSLVDADLAKESAQLQALQIRQQLGTQALSLANQAPQALMSLFR